MPYVKIVASSDCSQGCKDENHSKTFLLCRISSLHIYAPSVSVCAEKAKRRDRNRAFPKGVRNGLLIQFPIVSAGSEIRPFRIFGTERAPSVRTVDVLFRYVMKRYGDAQHTGERDQVFPHMAVDERAVILRPSSP